MSVSHHNSDENSNLNPLHEPVWVQCEGYRCLAVLDSEGQWRSYFNRAPIQGVIGILTDSGSRHSMRLQ